jgi:hypothetical protein
MQRLSMRPIREVLRLRFASQLLQRAIARSLGLSQGAVSGYLSRARAAGVAWPLPENVDDASSKRCYSRRRRRSPRTSARCPTGAGCIASCAARM